MVLRRLLLHDFRNIGEIDLRPDGGFNVLWGENAQGKTNLLEAVNLLGTLKSFRGAKNQEFIRHGECRTRLEAEIDSRGVRHRVNLTIEETGKNARVDGKDVQSAGEFFGLLRPVVFSPEEVGLAKGAPAGRRTLIDRALFQTDTGYLDRMRAYDRTLRQRNKVLKEGGDAAALAPWTEKLAHIGGRIRHDRSLYLNRLRPLLAEAYRSISGGRETAAIDIDHGGHDSSLLERQLLQDLENSFDREARVGQTLAGPHRDDPIFQVQDRSLRTYGSQGQQRSFLLAFKTAQIMDLEACTGEPPVLLLDDMTGELDRRRQEFFFNFLLNREGQVFITTTEVQPLIAQGLRQARFFRVDAGTLCEECMA